MARKKKAVAFRKMCRLNEPVCTIEFLQSTGDEVQVVYTAGTDNTPVRENTTTVSPDSGSKGFGNMKVYLNTNLATPFFKFKSI